MKKTILLLAAVAGIASATAQTKYFTREGNIRFSASTPLEKIEAENNKGTSVIDAATGQVEFAVLMKAFVFEKALMQEHFHENYVESDKYPKSTFKGTITNIKEVLFKKDGTYPVTVEGQLTLHGVTHDVKASGTIVMRNGNPVANIVFPVLLADYNIAIPSLVRDKISKSVTVTVDAAYAVFSN